MSKASIVALPAGLVLIIIALATAVPKHTGELPDWQPVLLAEVQAAEKQASEEPASDEPASAERQPTTGAPNYTSDMPQSEAPNTSLIDLNRATAEQFTALPGIGPAKAAAIVNYRTAAGGFRTSEQLMEVKGIGPKTYEKLKERIIVQ